MRTTQMIYVAALLGGALGLAACDSNATVVTLAQGQTLESSRAAEVVTPADVAGRWDGLLDVGAAELNLVLELSHEDGVLSGQLISVDQGNAEIPLESVTLEGATLRFTDPPRGVVYEGVVGEDDVIVGTFTQAGRGFPLSFARSVSNPVEEAGPTAPDTRVTVADPETAQLHQLTGTLLQPEDGARAAVVILSGSGPQDRNGTIAGQALYSAWADVLAEQGVASLRLDDRGVGGSDPVVPASPNDLALDAAAALDLVRMETGLNCAGFVGHSEGGWIALLAGPRSQANFVISMAGMHEPMETTLVRQSEAIIRASGGGDAAVRSNRSLQEAVFSVLRVAGPDDDISGQIETALIEAGAPQDLAEGQAAIWGQPYMAAAFQMDPRDAARAYTGPVLALFGQNDTQVLAGPNADALLQSRPEAETRTVTVEGVDHLFHLNESGAPAQYGSAGHAISPGAAEVFAQEVRTILDQACAG